MAKSRKTTTDFAEYVRAKLKKNPLLSDAVDDASIQADIAEEIYQARTEARLTQKQLAERIGSHQSVIARMEDADYQGHSIAMLRRIASATGKRLDVSFRGRPLTNKAKATSRRAKKLA